MKTKVDPTSNESELHPNTKVITQRKTNSIFQVKKIQQLGIKKPPTSMKETQIIVKNEHNFPSNKNLVH